MRGRSRGEADESRVQRGCKVGDAPWVIDDDEVRSGGSVIAFRFHLVACGLGAGRRGRGIDSVMAVVGIPKREAGHTLGGEAGGESGRSDESDPMEEVAIGCEGSEGRDGSGKVGGWLIASGGMAGTSDRCVPDSLSRSRLGSIWGFPHGACIHGGYRDLGSGLTVNRRLPGGVLSL